MVYGPYYRQRGALTGTPASPEALYGEDVRRPAIRSDDLYERYGEASPYERVQMDNKRAITGLMEIPGGGDVGTYGGEINPGYSAPPKGVSPFAAPIYAMTGWDIGGGRAPFTSLGSLGRIGDALVGLGTKAGLGMLGVPGFINSGVIARAFVIPLLAEFAQLSGLNLFAPNPPSEISDEGLFGHVDEGMEIPMGEGVTQSGMYSDPWGGVYGGIGGGYGEEAGGGFGFPGGYSF